MLKCRILCLCLVLVLLCGMAAAAGNEVLPYAVRVNRALNTVTIYSVDQSGNYTIPVKAMICSTARAGHETPLGSYTLKEHRSEWRLMLDGTYGQYATCFSGNYLFHSICYSDDAHDAMVREAYNALGEAASMGCVRLETADAKWIFDNCPAGTPVTIYDDPEDPGPLGKPERTVDEILEDQHNGWDPTDPAEGNPWMQAEVKSVTVTPKRLTMYAGESAQLQAAVKPETAAVFWSSSDETVAAVDAHGAVTALSAGTAVITAKGYRGADAQCTVKVEGDLLPYEDLIPGAWYYSEVRQAMEKGLFQGVTEKRFDPDGAMTRAMVVQVLYNLEGKPDAPGTLKFTDVAEDAWYRDAVAWASTEGVVNGVSEQAFAPNKAMTRQELAAVLWRYAGAPQTDISLEKYTDGNDVADFAETAMSWLIAKGILQGSGTELLPNRSASRVETAAILQRFTSK